MTPEGMPDMASLLAQAQQMQQQIMNAQASLASKTVEGSAGGGLVVATVTGTGELVGMRISPEAADPTDTETLADLVLAAVRDAQAGVQRLTAETMGPFAAGMGLDDGMMSQLGLGQ